MLHFKSSDNKKKQRAYKSTLPIIRSTYSLYFGEGRVGASLTNTTALRANCFAFSNA